MQKIRRNLKLFIQQEANLLETTTIRSVHELNEKFKQINDIYSFHNLIEQISSHISKMIFEKDKFCKFMRRLIEAICFALEKYAYDFSRTAFLVETLNTVKKHWKKVLAQQFSQVLEKKNLTNSKFLYILSKNQYMVYVLKCSNVLIEKQIFRLIKNNSINIKQLFYIKNCFLKNIWTKIYDEMVEVAEQTQNQTYLKIQLMAEFMKHTLFQVNFCITQSDFDVVYQRLFELAGYAFRLIKKFYSVEIFRLIHTIKQVLLKGIMIYREISFEFPNKFRYLTNLIKLFEQKMPIKRKGVTISNGFELNELKSPIQQNKSRLNPKGYAIKLALRLMASWKKVKSKKDKQVYQKERSSSITNHSRNLSNYKKTTKESQNKENVLVTLEKQQFQLKNKAQRSVSLHNFKNKELPILHNVHIRKQIKEQIDKEFGKLKYLRNYTNETEKNSKKPQTVQKTSQRNIFSATKSLKRSFSLKQVLGIPSKMSRRKQDNEQKQINIQDYKQKLNLCRKHINTQNRIKLYHPDKHSLVPHGGKKVVTMTGSTFARKSTLLAPNQIKQKLRL